IESRSIRVGRSVLLVMASIVGGRASGLERLREAPVERDLMEPGGPVEGLRRRVRPEAEDEGVAQSGRAHQAQAVAHDHAAQAAALVSGMGADRLELGN